MLATVVGAGKPTEQREKRCRGHAELVALEKADRLDLSFCQRRAARRFADNRNPDQAAG